MNRDLVTLLAFAGLGVAGFVAVRALAKSATFAGTALGDFLAPIFTPDIVEADTRGRSPVEIAEVNRRLMTRTVGPVTNVPFIPLPTKQLDNILFRARTGTFGPALP